MSKKPQSKRKGTANKERPLGSTSTGPGIFLRLSDIQVAQVVQEAGDGGIKTLLFARLDKGGIRQSLSELLDDPLMNTKAISQTIVMGWIVLAAFTPPGIDRGVVEVAKELEMTPSTTHRYINTLKELGLIEKTVKSRYRMAVGDAKS